MSKCAGAYAWGVSRVLGKVLEDLHMRGPRQPSGGLGNPGSGVPIDGALSRLPLLEKKFHGLHPEHATWIRKQHQDNQWVPSKEEP